MNLWLLPTRTFSRISCEFNFYRSIYRLTSTYKGYGHKHIRVMKQYIPSNVLFFEKLKWRKDSFHSRTQWMVKVKIQFSLSVILAISPRCKQIRLYVELIHNSNTNQNVAISNEFQKRQSLCEFPKLHLWVLQGPLEQKLKAQVKIGTLKTPTSRL